MKLGFHFSDFTYGATPATLGDQIDDIVTWVDEAGFDRLSVMDHYFQIAQIGPAEHEMFEAYNLLGYIAARTSRVRLGVLATGVTYRNPGYLVKQVTGLDVLSRGRAWLGIGAAWFEREHHGLGIPFPPLAERFERLEETLRIARQMWSDDNGPFEGKHYQLAETICSPQPVQQPHPPVLVAGSGERKTLRLVAEYADGCNVFGNVEHARHLMGVLREHCENAGRDPDEITKTRLGVVAAAPTHEGAQAKADFLRRAGMTEERAATTLMTGDPDELAAQAAAFVDAGIEGLTVTIPDVHDLETVQLVGKALGGVLGSPDA
jgi:F420-dependent oxidoreductase-like protein